MGQAEQLSRRAFLDRATKILAAGILLQRSNREQLRSPEREPSTFDILGVHDTPTPGGSRNIDLLFQDIHRLGMDTLVCIDPSGQIIQAARDTNTRLIVRMYQKDNIFDEHNIRWTLNKFEDDTNTIFQPYNEPNLEGVPLSPEEHIHFNFMPAARLIVEKGAKVLFTPVAPCATFRGITYDQYYKRQLIQLVNEFDDFGQAREWIHNNVVVGEHAYAFRPGENPYASVAEINRITQEVLGTPLPIEITEGGLSIDYPNQYTPEIIAQETRRIALLPIPGSLRGIVRSFCIWLIANSAQRDDVGLELDSLTETQRNDYLRFNDASLRKSQDEVGETQAYRLLADLNAA